MSKTRRERKRKQRDSARTLDALPKQYRDALLALESHERPEGYPGLNAETRRAASGAQFLSFVRGYWADWRHTKIRLYRKLLHERAAIARHEAPRWEAARQDPDAVVYHQVTNGVLAAAASEFCQYAEDLAGLARACATDQYFARDLAEAKAGQMQAAVKAWTSIDEEGVARVLRFPMLREQGDWRDTRIGRDYFDCIARAVERLQAVGELYRQHEFHFMRYKHGLLLALTQTDSPTPAFFEKRKTSLTGHAAAFDCGAVLDPASRGEPVFSLPDIGPGSIHVRLNAAHLAAERNLLRLIPPKPLETSIELFERAASFVSQLQRVLLNNRVQEIQGPAHDPYFMPAEDSAAVTAFYQKRHGT